MTTTPHEEQHPTERLAHALEERVKELRCLYDVSAILADQERSVDEKLQSLVERLPAGNGGSRQPRTYTALSNSAVGLILLAGGVFGVIAQWFGIGAVLTMFASMAALAILAAAGLNDVQAD